MPLEQLANIAEVLGMVVVAITLIFLTVQLRQSTRATRSASAIQSHDILSSWYRDVGNSEESSALFYNALADPDSQTPERWLQFAFLMHSAFLGFQNSYYLAKEGTIDEGVTQSLTEAMVGIKDQPGFQRVWRQRKSIYLPEFQDFVDAIISSTREVSVGLYKEIDAK